jgi:hypothetical protein
LQVADFIRGPIVEVLIAAIVGARAVMIETDDTQEGAWFELTTACGPASLIGA